MQTQVTGTFVDGVVRLDVPIDIPDNSRVQLSIEMLNESNDTVREKVESWIRVCEENPIVSGGLKFSREQLYE